MTMGDLVVDHTLRTLVRPVGFRSVPRSAEDAPLMMVRFWTGSARVDVLCLNDEDEVEAYRAQPDPQQPEDPYLFWRDVGSVCEMATAVRRELVPPRAGSVPLIRTHLREQDVPVPRPVGEDCA